MFSHVRLSIYPGLHQSFRFCFLMKSDGGLKRLRIFGYPLAPSSTFLTRPVVPTLPALPLTVETFKPYGQVIQGFSLPTSAPKGIDVTTANQGTATKFHRLGKVTYSDSEGLPRQDKLSIACTRAESQMDSKAGGKVPVMMLER